jgi:hypothetical protein
VRVTRVVASPVGSSSQRQRCPAGGSPGSAGIKVVSERIGHADPIVTMQVYAHALEGDDATAAEITATAIFGDP